MKDREQLLQVESGNTRYHDAHWKFEVSESAQQGLLALHEMSAVAPAQVQGAINKLIKEKEAFLR